MARLWRNYTDLPDVTLRAIYDAVCPAGLPAHDVAIKNLGRGSVRGRAYTRGSGYHVTARPFVVVSVARTDVQARQILNIQHRPGYLTYAVGSRIEAVVAVLAHELRHLWQASGSLDGVRCRSRRGMVWGSRGQFSERDADAYALQMLRRFRRGELIGLDRERGL